MDSFTPVFALFAQWVVPLASESKVWQLDITNSTSSELSLHCRQSLPDCGSQIMEDEDHIAARQQEETSHLSGSDHGTEAYTTEDALSDHDSNRKKAKLRWYGNTKPERDLVKQIKATRRKNLSRILYRAFLIEQRRKETLPKGQKSQKKINLPTKRKPRNQELD